MKAHQNGTLMLSGHLSLPTVATATGEPTPAIVVVMMMLMMISRKQIFCSNGLCLSQAMLLLLLQCKPLNVMLRA